MRRRKSNYELSKSQVDTPPEVVSKFWQILSRHRHRCSTVLDLGAGDGRFAIGGRYDSYLGLEIDRRRRVSPDLPSNAEIAYECAFRHEGDNYSACIGNPPYVRHHDLEPRWRDAVAGWIFDSTGYVPNRKCNLYIYFLFLSLIKASNRGIVAAIVPYEWLSRPSCKPLRQYVRDNRWSVSAYRFAEPIFENVETTASIAIIDKRSDDPSWRYHTIDAKGIVESVSGVTGTRRPLVPYTKRGDVWAMRGMSPGNQKVFTLTEGERVHVGLTRSDVYPCVTTLRHLPESLSSLTKAAFEHRFVRTGAKCWLIKSNRATISKRLEAYISSIPKEMRETATCINRNPWYKFALAPIPDILVSSGFVGSAPKAVINSVGAYAIGGVHGVHGVPTGRVRGLRSYVSDTQLASRVVAHSGNLRKLEVNQLNYLLKSFFKCR